MTDVVERLRAGTGGGKHWMDLHTEAANEIEHLRQICRDVSEIWEGSEGIRPITPTEEYLLMLLDRIHDVIKGN